MSRANSSLDLDSTVHINCQHNKDKDEVQSTTSSFKASSSSEMPSSDMFECSECRVKLSSKDDAIRHAVNHQRPFTCTVCNTTLTHRRQYKSHIRTHGIQDNHHKVKYKCDQCAVHCSTLSALRKHILIHTNQKPYLCEMCGSRFRRPGALHVHISAVHKPVDLHHCTQCGSNTRSRVSLLRHIQCVHGGVRRFVCGLCGARCLQNQDLRRHLKLAHDAHFPPLSSIGKKPSEEIHVIPSTEYLSDSDPLFELIKSIVKEEQSKLLDLKTPPQESSTVEDKQDNQLLYGSQLSSDNKQSLFLLGDVASKATPLKHTSFPSTSPHHQVDLAPIKSPKFACSLCQFESNDLSSLANHILGHSSKIPSVEPVRNVPLQSSQPMLWYSFPSSYTLDIHNPVHSFTPVPTDVFPYQTCVVSSECVDVQGLLPCTSTSNSYSVPGVKDFSIQLEGLSLMPYQVPIGTKSCFQNVALASHAIPALKQPDILCSKLSFASENVSVSAGPEEHFALRLVDMDEVRLDSHKPHATNAVIPISEDNLPSDAPGNTLPPHEDVPTIQNFSVPDHLQEKIAVSFENVGGILTRNQMSAWPDYSPDVVCSNISQSAESINSCSGSAQLLHEEKRPQDEGASSLWNNHNQSQFDEVLLSTVISPKNKEGSSVSSRTVTQTNSVKNLGDMCGIENISEVLGNSPKDFHEPSTSIPLSESVQNMEISGVEVVSNTRCDLSASSKSSKVSEENGPYQCKVCGKELSCSYNLKRHLKVHDVDKSHQCLECGKSFHHAFNLSVHLRSHSGLRPYVCKLCSKTFRYPREFKDHCNKHEGKRLHHCLQCGLKFTRQRELSRHAQKHEKCERSKCPVCLKTFSRTDYLRMHIGKFHSKVTDSRENVDSSGDINSANRCSEISTESTALESQQDAHQKSRLLEDDQTDCRDECLTKSEVTGDSHLITLEESMLDSSKCESQKSHDFLQILEGCTIDDNLINVAYYAAEGDIQLVFLNETGDGVCDPPTSDNNNENILHVEVLDSTKHCKNNI